MLTHHPHYPWLLHQEGSTTDASIGMDYTIIQPKH